jgi:DNA-binding SARP family transcriptional activator
VNLGVLAMGECTVRIGVLGAVRVWRAGGEFSPGAPLRCAVLAMLALRAGRLVTMGELIEGLWGERAPASAEGSIYTYVSGLRSVLAPGRSGREHNGLLEGDRSGYLLRIAREDVDALNAEERRATAQRLRESGELDAALSMLDDAVARWRGEPLAGVPGPFAEADRARLSGLRWTLLEERADVALALGRHAEIAAELTALVRHQPMRERLVGAAMTALYRGGRQAEALEMFQQVRKTLAAELGVDPSPVLSGLHEQILRTDPGLDRPQPNAVIAPTTRVPTRPAVPAQLPHDVTEFTGREAELAWLRGLISSDAAAAATNAGHSAAVVISAIDGCGGIGKTALAVRLAHQMSAEFPDGQLCLDLRGFDPQLPPLDPAEALSRLLGGLGAEAREVPDELDVQAAHYRSQIAGKRMLILLDNAVSTEQIKDLLPGSPGCLVLVTSRNRLGGLVARHGARRLTLDVLSEPDAATLLRRTLDGDGAEHQPELLAELAELCGRFPLALRIAAERLSARGPQALSELVHELRLERDRLDLLSSEEDDSSALRAVFSWSYHALHPQAARLFRLLSVHAAPEISMDAAAAIANLPVGEARKLLRILADGHLMEDAGYQRFRFHDLLRVYAGERAADEEPDAERQHALRRMLGHYLHTTHNACGVVTPNIPLTELDKPSADVNALALVDVDAALNWMDREQNALVTAVRQAAKAEEYRTAWQLVERIREVMQMHRTTVEWVEIITLGIDCARRLDDQLGRAALLNQRGYARIRSCEYQEALADLERARSIYTELGHTRMAARALGNIANVYSFGIGDDDSALPLYVEAGELLGAAGDLDGQARALGGIAELHAVNGRYDEALDNGRRVLQIFTDLGDTVEVLRSRSNLASHELRAGRSAEALPLLVESLESLRDIGDQFRIGTCLTDLARCRRELGDFEAAVECARESIELLRPRDPGPLGDALLELGRAQRDLGQLDEARHTFTEALGLAEPNDEPQRVRVRAELDTLTVAGTASA